MIMTTVNRHFENLPFDWVFLSGVTIPIGGSKEIIKRRVSLVDFTEEKIFSFLIQKKKKKKWKFSDSSAFHI